MNRPPKEFVDRVMRDLSDKGKVIEAGWESYRLRVLPMEAPPVQVRETRLAFFCGASYLFSSIMHILEPGDTEPTEADLRRMDLIARELQKFEHEFELREARVGGHG